MLNLTVTTGKRHRRKSKKYLFLLYTIIPFLAFFFYILTFSGLTYMNLFDLFIYTPPKAKYETFRVSFDIDISQDIQNIIISSIDDIQLNDTKRFEFVKRGEYKIQYSKDVKKSIYFREYVPVGHMYWIEGNTSLEDIQKSKKVYVSNTEYEIFKPLIAQLLGEEIMLVGVEDLLATLKESEEYVGLISVSDLSKGYKVLTVDGSYCFSDPQGCFGIGYELVDGKRNEFVGHIIRHNMELKYGESKYIDSENILKINMSGVVALSRNLASKMDSTKNYAYPAKYLGKFLADADLTHASNEVSFVSGCTGYTGMRFCSKPEYIETLQVSGIDIVELTGNHNNDYGASNNQKTIETYISQGWDYFGGGLNKEDASKVLYKEMKGNLVAFMGYNYYNTMYDAGPLAKESTAGANSYSVDKLRNNIIEAKEQGAVVVVTFQFQECYSYPSSDVIYPICYKPLSSPDQKKVFREAIDLGADIVVGTQAHQPQTYELYKEGIIFYGLGNLYFDQKNWIGTRQGIILSLFIQDNDLIQVKITPTLMDTNLIPNIAEMADSNLLLNLLKSARTF